MKKVLFTKIQGGEVQDSTLFDYPEWELEKKLTEDEKNLRYVYEYKIMNIITDYVLREKRITRKMYCKVASGDTVTLYHAPSKTTFIIQVLKEVM